MATLKTGYSVASTPCCAAINGRFYSVNDFDRMQVWDGVYATMRDAGIAGPAAAPSSPTTTSAGSTTVGTHLIRYRYLDSSSPAATYRSNASPALSYAISTATAASLTFSIGATSTAGALVRSTDTKVDTIQLEATAASGSDFYVVTSVPNTATTVSYNLADALLTLNEAGGLYDTNIDATTDVGAGHDRPPLGTIVAQCKNRTFIAGSLARTYTALSVTLSSTSVTGGDFSSLWTGRMLRITGDTAAYQISSTTSTTLTLTANYAGSTSTAATGIIYSRTPNTIYWSAAVNGAQLPESFKTTQLARNVLNGTGDQVLGLINWQGDLLIAGRYSMERLVFIDDPAINGELVSIAGKFGIWNQRCFVVVDGTLFGWGPNGIWQMRANGPAWISHPIDEQIASSSYGYIDVSRASQIHGTYDPTEKVVRWFFCKTGETVPRQAVCIDLDGRRWSRSQWRQGIDASVNMIDATGNYLAALSDSTNGQTWTHDGSSDGLPTTTTGDYTVTVSSTTTVVRVIDALPTTGTGLVGRMLLMPATGEERVIISNTASTITVAALASAPSAGAKAYVGSIPFSFETEWWDAGAPEAKKQAHLYLRFVPTTGGIARIRIYNDFGTSPMAWTLTDSVSRPNGVNAWVHNQTYVEVSLSSSDSTGFVKLPMFAELKRHLKASCEILSPAGVVRILEFGFQATRQGTKVVTNE